MEDTTQTREVRVESSQKRLRAYLKGTLVLDTRAPLLVWESPYYPQYYVPADDVVADLTPTGDVRRSPSRGDAVVYDVIVDGATAAAAAWRAPDSPVEALREAVRFDWGSFDAWFEEDERVYVHPRSPYTRVDILPSSRHVRVEWAGEVVADSHRPLMLFETGLPARYYLPMVDVRQEWLVPSSTLTACPYKGRAEYYSLDNGSVRVDDAVWTYPHPTPESQRIVGTVSFDPSKDGVTITVDGETLDRR